MRKGEVMKIGWMITVISPEELSWKMLDLNRTNLNEISHNAAIDLIRNTIAKGINVTEVYVDTVGDPGKYQAKLQRLFPKVSITVSKKADSLFPIVSAASIGAKVTRDRVLNAWVFKEQGLPSLSTHFGSGYPSDPKTKTWMQENVDKVFGFPSVVRFSWKPCQRIMEKSAVQVNWADGDNDVADQADRDVAQPKLKFGSRFRYFADNDMEVCTDL
jgi:ribonuclease H2 subunit A